jgi:hypothetical protein
MAIIGPFHVYSQVELVKDAYMATSPGYVSLIGRPGNVLLAFGAD